MGNSLGQVLVLIINTVGGLYLLALLVRFLLQASRADFYNPVSQALVKLTAPILNPVRRIIPAYKNFDLGTLLVALLFSTAATALMLFVNNINFSQAGIGIGKLISWSFTGMIAFILDIYLYGLIISVIASWVAPFSGNPVLILIQQLLEPVQSLFRKIIPPMGGIDFSPIFIFLAIRVLNIMIVGNLAQALRIPTDAPRYIIGI